MKEIICKILGHKIDKMHNDSGCFFFKRCGSHEYYDDWTNKDKLGFIVFPLWVLKLRVDRKIYSWKCKRNGLPF